MGYSITLNFMYLSMKMNGKLNFLLKKNEILNPVGILRIPHNF